MGVRKKTVNVTIDPALLDAARALNVNLSQIFASSLEQVIREAKAERWRHENQDLMAAYNSHFEEYGCLSDEFRNF